MWVSYGWRLSGLKTRVKVKRPRALFIYHPRHALTLVIRHAIYDIPACKLSMAVVSCIARHVKHSKGWTEFQEEDQERREPVRNRTRLTEARPILHSGSDDFYSENE
ncbi:hypothetical protein LOD99_3064 [Oopsacas minuta]|uniref:Uncharacterized protein n=1 Tax=Oopsacas minuta TaxID=111878 RepID=A0AAV7JYZ4_9METZ|nr:hypothetical protein LOD99_3064 [Oopsacas minuta]